jgi:hypothetical protein
VPDVALAGDDPRRPGTVVTYNGVKTVIPNADRATGGYLGPPRERGTYAPPPPAPRQPPAPQEPAKTPWWRLDERK